MALILYLPEKLTRQKYRPPTLKDRIRGPMFSQYTGEALGFWNRLGWDWFITDDPKLGELDVEWESQGR